MKNLILITVLSFFVLPFSLIAQIKVNSSGYVGINNTNPTYRLDVAGIVRFTNGTPSISWDGTSFGPLTSGINSGTSPIRWNLFYTTYGYFTYAPIVTSDIKLKTDITDLTGMNAKLSQLRPVSYKLNPNITGFTVDKTNTSTQFGFIAQDLKNVFPDMVKDDNGLLGISYTELIPVLVKALQEQQEEIKALNDRITLLEKGTK
jgi:hypothetical protein